VVQWLGSAIAAVLLAGLGISLWQMERAITAETEAKQNAETARRNEELAKAKTQEVQDTLVIVQQRTKIAQDAYGDFVFGIQDQLENRPETLDLRRTLLGIARKGLAKILEDARKQGTPDSTLVWSNLRMGDVERQLGNTLAAQKEYQTGHEMAQRLADADPKNAEAQTDLFISYFKLGSTNNTLHNYDQVIEFFTRRRAVLLPWHEKGLLVVQFKKAVSIVDRELVACRNAQKAIADIEFVFQQPPEKIADLLALRGNYFLSRKQPAEAVKTAERFAAWVETVNEKFRDEHRYKAACVYALCAAALEEDREPLVERWLALLQKAKAGSYFKEKSIAHIKKARDFNGVRRHPKFVAFMKGLEKKSEVAPPPKDKK
jgi:tetratricopeptide (TPR) repeat protein